jgi:hypothetical protein
MDPDKLSTEILEAMFQCSTCMCPYEEARSLPCGHTFCGACLHEWRQQVRKSAGIHSSTFPCPVCRTDHSVQVQAKPNFAIRSAMQAAEGKVPPHVLYRQKGAPAPGSVTPPETPQGKRSWARAFIAQQMQLSPATPPASAPAPVANSPATTTTTSRPVPLTTTASLRCHRSAQMARDRMLFSGNDWEKAARIARQRRRDANAAAAASSTTPNYVPRTSALAGAAAAPGDRPRTPQDEVYRLIDVTWGLFGLGTLRQGRIAILNPNSPSRKPSVLCLWTLMMLPADHRR